MTAIVSDRRYICGLCENGFTAANSDAEIAAEFEARFGREYRAEDATPICLHCDRMITEMLNSNPDVLAAIEAKCGPIDFNARPVKVM